MTDEAPPGSEHATHELVRVQSFSTGVLVLMVLLWSLAGPHVAKRTSWLTESSTAALLGLAAGVLLLIAHSVHAFDWTVIEQLLEFNAAGFFTYLLPPVIWYAGLSVEKQHFFRNLPTILMYGVLGTLASFLAISLALFLMLGLAHYHWRDCLAMGAIFAATDSVAVLQVLDRGSHPLLFSLVFGEGLINDATSVVLLGALTRASAASAAASSPSPGDGGGGGTDGEGGGGAASFMVSFGYLLVTSLGLGAAGGLLIALLLKRTRFEGPHQEAAVVGLLGYLIYLSADVCGLSGILSLFVGAIMVSHYGLHSLSDAGRTATLTACRTLSYMCEGLIFIYVGMDALDPLKWKRAYATGVVWLTLSMCVLLPATRAAFVVPFSIAHNMWSKEPVSSKDVIVIWWAGLMRGAVSVAMVYVFFDDRPLEMVDRHRSTLIVSTLLSVLLSILGVGALTKPLLSHLLMSGGGGADGRPGGSGGASDGDAAGGGGGGSRRGTSGGGRTFRGFLGGDGGDRGLVEELRAIPLLRGHLSSSPDLPVASSPRSDEGTGRYQQPRTAAPPPLEGGAPGAPPSGGGGGGATAFLGLSAAAGAASAKPAHGSRLPAAAAGSGPGRPAGGGPEGAGGTRPAAAAAAVAATQPPPAAGGGDAQLAVLMGQVGDMWSDFDTRVMRPLFGGPGDAGSASLPARPPPAAVANGGGEALPARPPPPGEGGRPQGLDDLL